MIELTYKAGDVSNIGEGCDLQARINGRVRNFKVRPSSVKEWRPVGGKMQWCKVRDNFLAGELSVIASCSAIAATPKH